MRCVLTLKGRICDLLRAWKSAHPNENKFLRTRRRRRFRIDEDDRDENNPSRSRRSTTVSSINSGIQHVFILT